MTTYRLRSQLLIAALLIIVGLTGSLLFFIRYTVNAEIHKQVLNGTEKSLRAFESVQRQRELQLSRTAAMLADLPTLKALMSTEHALTIQDGSQTLWKLAGSDLFVLAKPNREVLALHMSKEGWSTGTAERDLKRSTDSAPLLPAPERPHNSWACSPLAIRLIPGLPSNWPSRRETK
jgi:hypothetical protein